ncbi:hypothetical protein GUITHDRAFT_121666 [Guillardia theta CCMP2712]|uniref:Uncharacterized protein n=1 Tax=Guillardia theta (strain CCMP2712) TaxID=905079 RepID=L1I7V1_GUITC|nr:hypothetical protein GUITHDRAFT_121666 [Guillardia theta CCMP2712]EKX32172.1 hypothetical protein GUITHDRAFT_121666 [Guillardia theta CCMP2712]|eukprot:XP_005819152.1 hypothetical protein GUITHDRAFT_121666 [Guillardia theta CCMP2712]
MAMLTLAEVNQTRRRRRVAKEKRRRVAKEKRRRVAKEKRRRVAKEKRRRDLKAVLHTILEKAKKRVEEDESLAPLISRVLLELARTFESERSTKHFCMEMKLSSIKAEWFSKATFEMLDRSAATRAEVEQPMMLSEALMIYGSNVAWDILSLTSSINHDYMLLLIYGNRLRWTEFEDIVSLGERAIRRAQEIVRSQRRTQAWDLCYARSLMAMGRCHYVKAAYLADSEEACRWYDSATSLFEQAHQLICQARRLSPPLAHLFSCRSATRSSRLIVPSTSEFAWATGGLVPPSFITSFPSSYLTQRRRFIEDTAEARRRAHGWYLQAFETRRRLLPAGHPQIKRAKAGCDAHAADAEELNESQA